YVRVVVGHHGALLQQVVHELEAGRLARVIDILLVGHAQQTDLAALERLAVLVQGVGDAPDDVRRHGGVDLAGQLDEARGHAVLARHPGQVKRVDGNAVAPQTGTGVERLEAERLGPGRVDHLPHVNTHAVEDQFQLIDQGDVDG